MSHRNVARRPALFGTALAALAGASARAPAPPRPPGDPADPFSPLAALVDDRIALRVLKRYCEHQRKPGTTLEEAIASVAGEIKRGHLDVVLDLATTPAHVRKERQELEKLILAAVARFRGADSRDSNTTAAIRNAVVAVCLARYPGQKPRFVRQAVKAAVGWRLTRLELNVKHLVGALAALS